jgi:hypothetical protein
MVFIPLSVLPGKRVFSSGDPVRPPLRGSLAYVFIWPEFCKRAYIPLHLRNSLSWVLKMCFRGTYLDLWEQVVLVSIF